MRVLRHGLEVSEMAVSELPGSPNAVWTVKRNIDGKPIILPVLVCYEISLCFEYNSLHPIFI